MIKAKCTICGDTIYKKNNQGRQKYCKPCAYKQKRIKEKENSKKYLNNSSTKNETMDLMNRLNKHMRDMKIAYYDTKRVLEGRRFWKYHLTEEEVNYTKKVGNYYPLENERD